jgi:CRP-like cAMP-binding protein
LRHFQNVFNRGEYIVRQGSSGDTFYIISEGQVRVTKKMEGSGLTSQYSAQSHST